MKQGKAGGRTATNQQRSESADEAKTHNPKADGASPGLRALIY